ncbi:uncharacterized protein LOC131013626 [Salvia miltiorrhiza]|uniref:uncharacterized protein LOC131013626 n=1 Tax=Salvia miltiorrhiza TaxID=226208 RepID=UPI0025ABDD98|nr:uncharacterized protein LOC131013626 [Salvia miltiorrhiza]
MIKDNTAATSSITIKDTAATSPKGGAIVLFEATTWHDVKEEENPKEKIRARSNSVVVAAAEEEGKAMVLHRTLSEKHDREDHRSFEDEKVNEFSQMSNEELNKRVEEFIRRFNRQIRLQARHNLEMNQIQLRSMRPEFEFLCIKKSLFYQLLHIHFMKLRFFFSP